MDRIIQHLSALADNLLELNPVLIYLTKPDVCTTIRKVADERLSLDKSKYPDWIDHVIRYVTNSLFGQVNKLQGFDGAVAFFARRKEIELEALQHINMQTVIIENRDYHVETGLRQVIEAVDRIF